MIGALNSAVGSIFSASRAQPAQGAAVSPELTAQVQTVADKSALQTVRVSAGGFGMTDAPTKAALLRAQEASQAASGDDASGANGRAGIPFANAPSLEEYYSNDYSPSQSSDLKDMAPLRMPNAEDISALGSFVSDKFTQFLAQNGIPEAPDTIRFDDHGQMVLPSGYPYGDELKQALADNPGMERALRDLNGMSSQFAEIQKLKPYLDEVAQAQTQAESDAIVAKYMHLFDQNRAASQIALTFSKTGEVAVTADGKPLDLGQDSLIA